MPGNQGIGEGRHESIAKGFDRGGGEPVHPEINLSLQQQQKLVMTPELRQALAILQMPITDLEAYLLKSMTENPMLEVRDEPEEWGKPGEIRDLAVPEAPDLMMQWLKYFGSDYEGSGRTAPDDSYDLMAAFPMPAPTLHDHLHAQLRLLALPKSMAAAAGFLIDSLDDNGYLTLTVAEAAATLGLVRQTVEGAVLIVQSLDPVGVGARDLPECLLLQWTALGDGNPLVPRLIAHHLDDLAANRLGRIAEELGEPAAAVQGAADRLRALDPKPGCRFGRGSETRYIRPDAAVERVGSEYVVLVIEGGPRLTISAAYKTLLQGGGVCDDDTRRYLETKFHSALWLLRSVEQRRQTLYRVVDTLVRLQRPFFDRGVRHLRPLTLRHVAGELDIHESTVSRATAGKYVQTPGGLFELKFFFSSGVEGQAGGVSAKSVKQLLRDLIAHEDPTRPLSDLGLAQALAGQGVRISRRTVAKYREDAGIANSAMRRRY